MKLRVTDIPTGGKANALKSLIRRSGYSANMDEYQGTI